MEEHNTVYYETSQNAVTYGVYKYQVGKTNMNTDVNMGI